MRDNQKKMVAFTIQQMGIILGTCCVIALTNYLIKKDWFETVLYLSGCGLFTWNLFRFRKSINSK